MKYAIMHVAMRICPKCRLIASDDPVCPECGWNIAVGGVAGPASDLALRYAEHLQYMAIFAALMFGSSLLVSFTTTRGSQFLPAVSMGLLVTGLIADAVLPFPFGTLVFAWLLARRARLGGAAVLPSHDDEP